MLRKVEVKNMEEEKNIQIRESLQELFDEIMISMKHFKKKTYAGSFEFLRKKYHTVLASIPSEYHKADNQEEFVEDIAEIMPRRVADLLGAIPKKRTRELRILDYNLAMVSYMIPLLNGVRDDCMDQIIDTLIEKWNHEFPVGKISKSTYESIQGGFRSGLCYITTAVCESMGKSDDCYELNTLRTYRDEYLLEAGNGDMVKEYYNIAPTIVNHINKKENAKNIYKEVWDKYLSPCIHLIEIDKKEECKIIYSEMVQTLHDRYFYLQN